MKRLIGKPWLFLVLALFAGWVLSGCAAKKPMEQTRRMELPDLHIEVDPSGKLPPKFWDVYSLLNEGNRLFDQGRFEEALERYEKLLANYPGDEMAPLALYNEALCHEELGRFEQALSKYDALRRDFPQSFQPIEMSFRYAYCYEKLERWEQAQTALSGVVMNPDATPVQKLQARSRIAIAVFYSGGEEEAKSQLRNSLEEYEELRKRRINVDNYFYAKTCFTLGEYYYRRCLGVELVGDMKQLETALETKATLFVLARAQYLKAIKSHNREHVFSSTYRIGEGYELFYFSMLNAPLPDDLEPDQSEEYIAKLKEKIQPVFKKALYFYRQNIRLGGDMNGKDPWLIKTRERLDSLEKWQQENR